MFTLGQISPEGVKWELDLPFLEAGKWDFVHWDLDSGNKNNRKNGNGIWKKPISWEMGLELPIQDPLQTICSLEKLWRANGESEKRGCSSSA